MSGSRTSSPPAAPRSTGSTVDGAGARTVSDGLLLALPKGRIACELAPLLGRAGIEPEAAFADDGARQLRFATSEPGLGLIRVRSFDVATFVAFGAAPSRRRRQRCADGVRLPRDLCAPRPAHRPLPDGGCRAGGAGHRGRSVALEPCAGRHQVSAGDAPPFRRARRPGRMHQAQRRDGARAGSRALPPDRRPGWQRRHAQGQRTGRGGAYRRHLRPARGQPHRAQDTGRRAPGLDSSASARQ